MTVAGIETNLTIRMTPSGFRSGSGLMLPSVLLLFFSITELNRKCTEGRCNDVFMMMMMISV